MMSGRECVTRTLALGQRGCTFSRSHAVNSASSISLAARLSIIAKHSSSAATSSGRCRKEKLAGDEGGALLPSQWMIADNAERICASSAAASLSA